MLHSRIWCTCRCCFHLESTRISCGFLRAELRDARIGTSFSPSHWSWQVQWKRKERGSARVYGLSTPGNRTGREPRSARRAKHAAPWCLFVVPPRTLCYASINIILSFTFLFWSLPALFFSLLFFSILFLFLTESSVNPVASRARHELLECFYRASRYVLRQIVE